MKQISLWAKHHVPAARVLIVLLKITLFSAAIYLGFLLSAEHFNMPAAWLYLFAACAAWSALTYPEKKVKQLHFYRKQKMRDCLIGLSAFCVVAGITNRLNQSTVPQGSTLQASSIMHKDNATQIIASLAYRDKTMLAKHEKRLLKKEFFRQVKIYTKAALLNEPAAKGAAWKTILVIIGALGLLFLLAALTCSISCNGADGAAVIIGVLGLAGIIWGSVALIKRIQRGPPAAKAETPAVAQ